MQCSRNVRRISPNVFASSGLRISTPVISAPIANDNRRTCKAMRSPAVQLLPQMTLNDALISYAALERIQAALGVIGCLVRVAIDERAIEGFMLQAAHFMLDLEQHLAAVQINDVLKRPLFANLGNKATLFQETIGS